MRAPDVGNTSNLGQLSLKPTVATFGGFSPPTTLTSAPRYAVCSYLAMIDYRLFDIPFHITIYGEAIYGFTVQRCMCPPALPMQVDNVQPIVSMNTNITNTSRRPQHISLQISNPSCCMQTTWCHTCFVSVSHDRSNTRTRDAARPRAFHPPQYPEV